MRRRQLLTLTGLALLLLAIGATYRARQKKDAEAAAEVTFTKDVAPLVFARCAPCHRPGEAGPFSLLTYEDVHEHAAQILTVTSTRFMPPWRPVPGFAEYENDRSLTSAQIELLGRWVTTGAKRGDPKDLPKLPDWPKGWQLGEPDVIVTLPEAYTLSSEGTDVYRNFVIPSPVTGARFVKAWELRPNTRTIHHAILNIDRIGLARRRDREDPGPGFGGMDVGDVQSADGFYLVWTPGKVAKRPRPGSAWRLDERTDLVLQLHMQPSGKPETVRPTIGLFFTDVPPAEALFALRLGDPPIDIPPGEKRHVVKAELVLPADVDVLSVFPHAHLLARTIRSWATLPDGGTRNLLRIDDWDFNWQDEYTFAKPITLPKGAKLEMELTYDNSAENPRNPNHPPKRVTLGEQSTNEMGNLTFEVVPRGPGAMSALEESKFRRQLAAQETARDHYNLANVLAQQGKTDEAIEHYRRAVVLGPTLAPAHFNLGNVLVAKGDLDGGIAELRAAVKVLPDYVSAYVNLGNALETKGDKKDALEQFRAAVAANTKSALAQNSLALALAKRGDAAGAIEHFKASLELEPNNWAAHYHFGNALRAHGDKDEAAAHYRRALELRPEAREPREALDALSRE